MDEHPVVGEGPGFAAKLGVATLLGGFAVALVYGWVNDLLGGSASAPETLVGLGALAVLAACLLFVGRTVDLG